MQHANKIICTHCKHATYAVIVHKAKPNYPIRKGEKQMEQMWQKERYNQNSELVRIPEVDKFLWEITEVCQRHGFAISHEDGHGSFIIEKFSEECLEWLFAASVNLE